MTNITIRNLTSTPLTLQLVERYHSPEHLLLHRHNHANGTSKSSSWNLTSIFNGTSAATSPSHEAIASNAENFTTSTPDLRIEPFKAVETDLKQPGTAPGEKVRLTFECNGDRYRIDIPSSQNESQILIPLSPQPKHEFTAVYLPQHTFLSIHSSAQLNCWMNNMQDATPLSALSIPGTHNSPTHYKALPSVRCQAISPRQQLDNGVRFFDIRVQPESESSGKLILVHAVFPISLTGQKTFADLLTKVYAFLDDNQSETLIMSVKREGVGNMSDQQVTRILHDHYTTHPDHAKYWYTTPGVPLLGAVRGKIVLMRRLAINDTLRSQNNGAGWALDAECWADNTSNDLHGDVCVQDFYEVVSSSNLEKKVGYCKDHLARAGECVASLPGITCDAVHPVPPQPFFLNFLSASNFFKMDCWPERVAKFVNPRMLEWLCREFAPDGAVGDGGTGIVVLDWIGAGGDFDLVRCIVGMNSRLMAREMSLVGEKSM